MTVPSPNEITSNVLAVLIQVEGKQIPDTCQVLSIDTWASVNQIPRACIVLRDGGGDAENFSISSGNTFLPGNKIEIAAGYHGSSATIFKGVIVKQGITINQKTGTRLVVEAADVALKMTLSRTSGVSTNITDSGLFSKLISKNLLTPSVTATTIEHESIVQNDCTDWDLLLARAGLNSFLVTVEDGKVTVAPPDTQQKPVLLLENGVSILDLDLQLDAATQYAQSAIKSSSWDPATQQVIASGPATVGFQQQGNLTSADLAKVFNVTSYPLQTGAMIQEESLQAWSSSELLKSMLSKIQGEVRFQGSALVKAGKTIQLKGLGDRFNGTAFISGVHHEVTDGTWITTASLGLEWPWTTVEAAHVLLPEAAGQLPPINGLQTGKVKQVDQDPEGEFRILVVLPLLQNDANGVWARLSSFYASNSIGAVFFPEIGDEVIVGFMNNDPRYPVILGSVYSKSLPPAYQPDAANSIKGIVTHSKLQLSFNDRDKTLQLQTPGGHSLTLDDKSGSVTIKDSNGNSVTLSKSGIDLSSASNLNISATHDITITSSAGNLTMKAAGNAAMQGLNVSHTAQTEFSARGNAQATLEGSALVTIKGGMVNIN